MQTSLCAAWRGLMVIVVLVMIALPIRAQEEGAPQEGRRSRKS